MCNLNVEEHEKYTIFYDRFFIDNDRLLKE